VLSCAYIEGVTVLLELISAATTAIWQMPLQALRTNTVSPAAVAVSAVGVLGPDCAGVREQLALRRLGLASLPEGDVCMSHSSPLKCLTQYHSLSKSSSFCVKDMQPQVLKYSSNISM
jgi:hypothetical protein